MKHLHRIKPILTIRGQSGFNVAVHGWRLSKAPKGPYAAFQTVSKRQGKPWVRHMAKSLPSRFSWPYGGINLDHSQDALSYFNGNDAMRYLNGEFAADAEL